MLIQSGDSEVLRDEITLLAHKATLYGDEVTHELYEDMVHVFQTFTWLPAAKAAIESIGRWVQITLPKIEAERDDKEKVGRVGGEAERRMQVEMDADPRVERRDLVDEIKDVFGSSESPTGLGLNLHQSTPSIDLDSMPPSGSGSPTPTVSRNRSPFPPTDDRSDLPQRAPRLRRSVTSLASTFRSQSSLHNPSSPGASGHTIRRRRPTASFHPETHPSFPWSPSSTRPTSPRSAAAHIAPSGSISSYFPSNPTSPTPSYRRRNRSSTVTQTPPSMRERSKSHTDIHFLVEGYMEGGAANETTVYAAGGEIKSVGVLGEEDEQEE